MKKYLIVTLALILVTTGVFWLKTPHPSAPKEAATGYVIKNDKVYYDEVMQVQWADNKTHQQIHEFEVVGADAKTFTVVPLGKGINAEAEADPQIFSVLSRLWGKDKNNVYYQGQKLLPFASTTSQIDTHSFKPISFFFKDDKQVYRVLDNSTYEEIPFLDPNTFIVLTAGYVKDSHAVYKHTYDWVAAGGLEKLQNIDPNTFHVIGECGSAEVYHSYYVADVHTVMAIDKPIAGADPSTFRIVGEIDKNPDGLSITGSYSIDKNHVYRDCGELIPGASPEQCTVNNLKACEGK